MKGLARTTQKTTLFYRLSPIDFDDRSEHCTIVSIELSNKNYTSDIAFILTLFMMKISIFHSKMKLKIILLD
jgi:hypothetical protein